MIISTFMELSCAEKQTT